MKVLVCGFFLEGYPRYETLFLALKQLPIQIFDRKVLKTMSKWQTIKYALSLIKEAKNVDQVFIFPGNYLLVLLLGIFKPWHKASITFDLLISAFLKKKTIGNYLIEWSCSRFADKLLCVTSEYLRFYKDTYNIPERKLFVITDVVQDIWITHRKIPTRARGRKRVIYWGTYLPHHGIDYLISAASVLQDVEFIFCGKAPEEFLLQTRNLPNVKYKGFLRIEDLIDLVDTADITLGCLRNTTDTPLGHPNKQREGMARAKPVIASYTEQQENLFSKGYPIPAVVLVDTNTPNSAVPNLISTIQCLLLDEQRCREIGAEARKTILRSYTVENTRDELVQILRNDKGDKLE